MDSWNEYKDPRSVKATIPLAKVIIKELGKNLDNFFLYNSRIRPQRTTFIKDKLALLGHEKFGYKVFANGLSKELVQANGGAFKNVEWLYDMHWYTEGSNNYTTLRLPLVMECEWQQKRKGDKKVPFSGIKYDFQKLLVSNAELRLMLFNIEKLKDIEELSLYFMDNIRNYIHLEKGSAFLFIGFFAKGRTLYYTEMFKE